MASIKLFGNNVCLENEFWSVQVEPDFGGRASSIIYKPKKLEIVNTWEDRNVHGEKIKFAGAFGGHVTGSYLDEQINEPYRVEISNSSQLKMSWLNTHSSFDGLAEERDIRLNNKSITVKIRITNRATEPRIIMYRLQDFVGIGKGVGVEKVGIVPGKKNTVFPLNPQTESDMVFSLPQQNGMVFCDYAHDFGLLITGKDLVNALYLWNGRNSNTVEFFMPQKTLQPGESWTAEFNYQAFQISNSDDLPLGWRSLVKQENALASMKFADKEKSMPLPYRSICTTLTDPSALLLYPVPVSDASLGNFYPSSTRASLKSLELFGTPGERIDFALAIKAGEKQINSAWTLSAFSGDQNTLESKAWQLRYVSNGGYFLVKDQQLAKNANDELCRYNNKLNDTSSWTDLSLLSSEVTWVKLSYKLPVNAAPGNYCGSIEVAGQKVKIDLQVLPFQLNRDSAKTFGSFFRVFMSNSNPDLSMSREQFLDALYFADENWNNGIIIYVSDSEELRWSLDQISKMGWKNAVICPINTKMSAQEIKDLEKKYSYCFLTWGVDEPASYRSLVNAKKRLDVIQKGKYSNPIFTPSTFMGMIFADMHPEYIPVFNTNGMMTVLMNKSREYAQKKRNLFWYSCPTGVLSEKQQIRERLLHGLYLWKAPTSGIFDWGEDVAAKTKELGGYCGFTGKKLVSTIRRDNSYEGYKDYLYLKTLEDVLSKNDESQQANDARRFLADLSKILDDDYFSMTASFDHSSLDLIRRQAAELTAAIKKVKNSREKN